MSAYRRILVAVDGGPTAARGLKEAIRLANAHDAQLLIFHVVNLSYAHLPLDGYAPGVDPVRMLREGGREALAKAKALADKQEGIKAARTILRERLSSGSAADAIVSEARRQRADVIVLGTHGRRGIRRLVMGSDAEQVVRTSPVPVLLVRAAK